MQIRFCFESRFENYHFHFSCLFSCLYHYLYRVVFYMGLLQLALGLSRTKSGSPKDSYSTKPRENPDSDTLLFSFICLVAEAGSRSRSILSCPRPPHLSINCSHNASHIELYTLSFSFICLVAEVGGKLSRAVYLAPPPPSNDGKSFHDHFTCFKLSEYEVASMTVIMHVKLNC